MENRSRGALLSFVLLVLGSTLLPEPCDAGPRGQRPRHSRNAAPDPRCPNCAHDCPQNLVGDSIWARRRKFSNVSDDVLKVIKTLFGIGKSLLGSEINEDYQSLSSSNYQPPSSQPSYDTLPPSSAFSPPQPLTSYNPQPIQASYNAPAPVASYSSQLPAVPYTAPLPAPSYDPRLPPPPCNPPQTLTPPAETPCYNCPLSAPASFNLLPKSQNRYELWRRFPTKFNRSPYPAQEYRSRFYPQEASVSTTATDYDCECGCEPKLQLDDVHDLDDDNSFGTYNRRSSDGEAPRVSRHYNQAHYAEAPSPSTEMYKTYVPYVREENPNDPTIEYASDESERRGRERLYVVYRADALKPEEVSEDRPISERELETVIRKAIEIARQQRAQENALRRHVNQQYRYDYKPDSGAQRSQRQGTSSPVHIVAGEGPYALREEGDEVRNPGLDQSKWVAISALPKSDILADEEASMERSKIKAPEAKTAATESRKPTTIDLLGDMKVPQAITESPTLVGPAEEIIKKKS